MVIGNMEDGVNGMNRDLESQQPEFELGLNFLAL